MNAAFEAIEQIIKEVHISATGSVRVYRRMKFKEFVREWHETLADGPGMSARPGMRYVGIVHEEGACIKELIQGSVWDTCKDGDQLSEMQP